MSETPSTVETELSWAAKRVWSIGWEEHAGDAEARRHYRKAAVVLLSSAGMTPPGAAQEVRWWDQAASTAFDGATRPSVQEDS